MKAKLSVFYFLVVILSLSSFSQSLTLARRYSNTPVANNSTIEVRYPITSVFHNWDSLIVNNITGHPINVMVKKKQIKIVPGTENSICWGLCVDSASYSVGPVEITGNSNSTEFVSDYNPDGEIGFSIIRYTFYSQSNPSDTVCFNIKYIHPIDLGFNEIYSNYMFSNSYPNPAKNTANVKYSFSSEVKNASIVVSDLLGSKIKTIILNNNVGSVAINTSELNNGIYLYTLQLDGRNVVTRKLIVNR